MYLTPGIGGLGGTLGGLDDSGEDLGARYRCDRGVLQVGSRGKRQEVCHLS
jgi:hypothetical protein